ncbi:hypothetical protein QTG54_001240 [Skeletonema marinoi]|uniref:Uncharacterized protein n=1 Tax=Skeletonema marinoi TaxID=267567 RepID=A0AAD8YMF9_9STRA|nr:hypothetical protein QTG54_001240 [Skeletonema marinoi]
MILTVASSVTKRISKSIAPNFLRWSLRMHESLPASFSMLPLAQRLVSIEVQEDYQLISSKLKGHTAHDRSMPGKISSAWDNFVDKAWDVFFESRHQKLNTDQDQQTKKQLDSETLTILNSQRQNKRQQQHTRREIHDNEKTEYAELANQRVQLLDQYVRPALLPTGSEQDFNQNIFTNEQNDGQYDYFVKWIRGEYLIAKYGLAVQQAVKKHPALRDDAAGLNSVGDTKSIYGEEVEVPLDLILPKIDTIIDAFGMEDWSRSKVPVSSWVDADTNSHDNLSIKDIIHNKLHGQISYSGPLNAYFEMRRREDSYELWNYNYIFGLAQYLLDRINDMDSIESVPVKTTILDVGAGDGRLIYFLRRAMHEIRTSNSSSTAKSINLRRKNGKSNRSTKAKMKANSQIFTMPTLIATDDGSWKAPMYSSKHIEVEKLSAVEAVVKHAPPSPEQRLEGGSSRLIVLCSWMPPQVDWTADFRKHQSSIHAPGESGLGIVDEYILIGECDDGTCGHNYLTWGNPDAYESEDGNESSVPVVPYVEDGYQRIELEDLSLLQISRFDCKRSSESKTVSFRRGA